MALLLTISWKYRPSWPRDTHTLHSNSSIEEARKTFRKRWPDKDIKDIPRGLKYEEKFDCQGEPRNFGLHDYRAMIERQRMLNLNTIHDPSEHVKSRAASLTVELYDRGRFTATYKAGQRLVTMDAKRGVAECRSFESGEPCPRNVHGKLCSSVWAVCESLRDGRKAA